MNIIGLGAAGCNIADGFAQYPQYNVFKIDVGLVKGKGCYPIPESDSAEAYESDALNLKAFFKPLKAGEEVLFIVCGEDDMVSPTTAAGVSV